MTHYPIFEKQFPSTILDSNHVGEAHFVQADLLPEFGTSP